MIFPRDLPGALAVAGVVLLSVAGFTVDPALGLAPLGVGALAGAWLLEAKNDEE